MASSELSLRAVKRKIQLDGFINTAATAIDLFARSGVDEKIFRHLVEQGCIHTITREDLKEEAVLLVGHSQNRDAEQDSFVAQIQEGHILTETGLVLNKNMGIVEESAGSPGQAQKPMAAMCSRELFFGKLPIRRMFSNTSFPGTSNLSTAAPLIPRYPSNYYHWMVETVPKIRYLRQYEEQTERSVTVLVPSNAPPFIIETLELLDWPKSKIVLSNAPVHHVRDLVIASVPQLSLMDFEWIKESILDNVYSYDRHQGFPGNCQEKIYVSRENAISRRIINEEEVMEVLSKYGFERYLLENRSLSENARLFNQADVVVGPHGAGLTDIIFAEDCTLVELFGARRNKAYENLSETLGIRYEPMYCEAKSADIRVDIEELERHISQIVEDTQR